MTYAMVIILLTISGTQVASIRIGPEFAEPELCRLHHDGRVVAWTREIASVVTYGCEPSATDASGG